MTWCERKQGRKAAKRAPGSGAALTLASFLCVALVSALGKVAGEDASTGVVVLVQNLVGLLVIAPVVVRRGPSVVKTRRIGLHMVRAAAGTACWYALFVAVRTIPLTTVNLLTFSAPLWMPVLAWVAFRQRTSRGVWIGAALGFAGIVLVLQPVGHPLDVGELLAFGGALMLAIALIAVRLLGATEPTVRVLFYYFALSSVLVLPLAMLDWRPPTSGRTWWSSWPSALPSSCPRSSSSTGIDTPRPSGSARSFTR